MSPGSQAAPPTRIPALIPAPPQAPGTSRKTLDAPSWPGVYRLSLSLMERLLQTLRYNFLTEALDFLGVHQERTLQVRPRLLAQAPALWEDSSGQQAHRPCSVSFLQCLNAVRTVQSVACLEEADHTVGFILQLSNFRREWHFHLPQLMRDVQVGPCAVHQEGFSQAAHVSAPTALALRGLDTALGQEGLVSHIAEPGSIPGTQWGLLHPAQSQEKAPNSAAR